MTSSSYGVFTDLNTGHYCGRIYCSNIMPKVLAGRIMAAVFIRSLFISIKRLVTFLLYTHPQSG
jgi:hypothetical protein